MLTTNCLEHILATNKAVLFISGSQTVGEDAPNSQVLELFKKINQPILILDLLKDADLRDQVFKKTGWNFTPQLFLNGTFLGGMFVIPELLRSQEYFRWANLTPPDNLDEIIEPYLKKLKSPWKIAETKTHFWLASACGKIKSIHKSSLKEDENISVSKGWVNAIEVVENGSIAAGTTDGNIFIKNKNEPLKLEECYTHDRWINDFTSGTETSRLYAIDGNGQILYCESPLRQLEFSKGPNFGSTGWSIALSPDSTTLAVGLGDGRIILLNSKDFSKVYAACLHGGAITSIKAKGDAFYFCGYDGVISCLDNKTMQLKQTRAHNERVWDIAISGQTVATIGGDLMLNLLDLGLTKLKASFDLRKMPILIRGHAKGFCVFYSDGTCEANQEWC